MSKQVLSFKLESDQITFDQAVTLKNALDVAINKTLQELFDVTPPGLSVEIQMTEVP